MSWRLEVLSTKTLDNFVSACEELWLLSSIQHLKFDHHVTRMLGMKFIREPTFFCQVALDDNEIMLGFMAGYVTGLMFSNQHIGIEEGLYVREGVNERAGIAAEMLKRFVRFCKDCGCVDVRTGVISNIDNYAVDVFYRRNGFKRAGTIYSLRKPGDE